MDFFFNLGGMLTRSNCKSVIPWWKEPIHDGNQFCNRLPPFCKSQRRKETPSESITWNPRRGIYTTTKTLSLILAGGVEKWTQKYICVSNGSPCSPQVKKSPKLCKIESFQWSKKIILWSQGECLSKSYIKLKKKLNNGKRKQTLAMSQESFLERISLLHYSISINRIN